MKYLLEAREDNETGELGLLTVGTPLINGYPMVAMTGMLIAHDLTEHVNGHRKIGSIDDELEALGGVWYCRGRMLGRIDLEYDIVNLGEIYYRGVDYRNPVPVTRRSGDRYDNDFDAFMEDAARYLREGVREWGDEEEKERAEYFLSTAIHFIRVGYRKARKKYPNEYRMYDRFKNIERVVDTVLRDVEFEGQVFELSVVGTDARCHEVTDYYYH